MWELGNNLTPQQVVKLAEDTARLTIERPRTMLDRATGREQPLSDDMRNKMAEVINTLEDAPLRVVTVGLVSKLVALGYAIAQHPHPPPGSDPRLN